MMFILQPEGKNFVLVNSCKAKQPIAGVMEHSHSRHM